MSNEGKNDLFEINAVYQVDTHNILLKSVRHRTDVNPVVKRKVKESSFEKNTVSKPAKKSRKLIRPPSKDVLQPPTFAERDLDCKRVVEEISDYLSTCPTDELETNVEKLADMLRIWRDGYDFILVRVPKGTILRKSAIELPNAVETMFHEL